MSVILAEITMKIVLDHCTLKTVRQFVKFVQPFYQNFGQIHFKSLSCVCRATNF